MKKSLKLLFATKDIGGTRPLIALAKVAKKRGHTIFVVAEGKGIALWKAAGIMPDVEGPEDPITNPWDFDFSRSTEKPDIVICGQSSPIYIEDQIGGLANELGIPLVSATDFWGGVSRTKAKSDLVLAMDDCDAKLIGERSPRSQIVIVGNPGYPTVAVPEAVNTAVEKLRRQHGRVFVYCGTSPEPTTEEVRLLVKCLTLMWSDQWCLIPRYHPKHSSAKSGTSDRPYQELWEDELTHFGDRIVSVPEATSSDQLTAVCDITLSGFSLSSLPAIVNGKPVVSLWTDATAKSLLDQVGLSEFPLTSLGCVTKITSQQSLDGIEPAAMGKRDQIMPFDAEKALDAILRLVA